jgi:uncharacterized protein (TIGR00730 family)
MLKQICVFCGSSPGHNPVYPEAARGLGALLARRGLGLVYGGGKTGLMGALADAALAAGGRVTGVIPKGLAKKELVHDGLSDLRLVASMHERKALMAELAGGFLALPGGFGTFEEFCEILTWAQLGLHRKPCGLLNVHGYFNPLLELFDHAVSEGFVCAEHRADVLSGTEPDPLLSQMEAFVPRAAPRWIESSES